MTDPKAQPELARLPRSLAHYECCDLARVAPEHCICTVVVTCPTHGTKHHGSHD